MRYWTLLVSVLTALGVIACARETPHAGELRSFEEACQKFNEGRWIAVEGYLILPDAFSPADSVELRLYRDLTFSGKRIGAAIFFGDGPDEAQKINSSYRNTDLKVHLADGTLAPFGTRVRVSGRMVYPVVPQDYECGLENLYIEMAK
jgi:hypothetical protein